MKKAKDLQSQGRTYLGMNSVRWQRFGVSLSQLNDIPVIDIFSKKRKCCNQQWSYSVYFNTTLGDPEKVTF